MGTDYEGNGTAFADKGDLESAVVRLIRREDDEVSKDSAVVKLEVVEIVFGVVQERAGGPSCDDFYAYQRYC